MTHSTSGADGSDGWTRRRVLRASAVGTVAVGAAGSVSAQDTTEAGETEQETDGTTTPEATFELGARTDGWEGRAPGRIEGETNPALNLTAGTEYVVAWENLDGEEHDFVIRDDAGEEIESTDSSDEEGETLSLAFTATEEMARYVCSYHQDSMSGEVSVEADGTTAEGETTGGEETGDEETGGEETGDEGTTEGDDNEIAAGTPGQQEQTTIVGPDQGESPGEDGEGGGNGGGEGGDGAESDQPGFGALAAIAALGALAASRVLGNGDEEE